MSIIFSEKELSQIEKILGQDFIEVYTKIWDERESVKNYRLTVQNNLSVSEKKKTDPLSYWAYKLKEVDGILENQNKRLVKVLDLLMGKIDGKMLSKLETYITEKSI